MGEPIPELAEDTESGESGPCGDSGELGEDRFNGRARLGVGGAAILRVEGLSYSAKANYFAVSRGYEDCSLVVVE